MMKRFLENKVCLITGGGRGIGRAIAERFAGDGAIVYAGDIQWDEPDHWTCAVAEKYQTKVIPVLLDVTDREMVKKTLMGIHKQEGRIDCVVNNAAIISNQKLGMVLRENLEQMYRVNVFAVIEMIQTVSRLMARSGGGSIINMASVVGVSGNAGQCNYSASKAGMIGLAKSIAKEMGPRGIRANAIAPGFIITEMTNAHDGSIVGRRACGMVQEDTFASRRYTRGCGEGGSVPCLRPLLLRERTGNSLLWSDELLISLRFHTREKG